MNSSFLSIKQRNAVIKKLNPTRKSLISNYLDRRKRPISGDFSLLSLCKIRPKRVSEQIFSTKVINRFVNN